MFTQSEIYRSSPPLRLHRGINFSNLDVPADAGGTIFTVGSVFAVLFGLPFLIPFYAAAFAGGVVIAVLLAAYHRRQV